MDYEIRLTTKGDYLSLETLSGITRDIKKKFEKSLNTTLKYELPNVSTTRINKQVKGNVKFIIKDIRRGSWEILLIGSIAGIIGKGIYDLTMDYIKTSDQWKDFKERVKIPSKKVAEGVSGDLSRIETLGPLAVKEKRIRIEQTSSGYAKLTYEVVLAPKKIKPDLIDSEEQLEYLIKEIEDKINKQ